MKYKSHTQIAHIKQYFRFFFNKEKNGWIKLISYYNIYIPLGIVGLIALAIYINPLPPKTAYLAIGQDGSSYRDIAKNYQSFFKKNGIDLELVATSGLTQGLKRLHGSYSEVNASFLTVGIANEEQYPGLVSLGSVQYAPIWIFYRGSEIKTNDPFEYLLNKKISIGLPGSATNIMFQKLNEVSTKKVRNPDTLFELSHKDGVEALTQGKIDALFIVDSSQSDLITQLAQNPSIKIMNFSLADAYIKKLPFLQKLTIPKGSRSIENLDPAEDLTILASTTNLLVEKETHRAIQWAFLLAARENDRHDGTFFSTPNFFPKDIDQSFPLSPIAEHFYNGGVPSVFEYIPIWTASLLDSMWVYILAIITLIYPFIKLIESIRLYPSEGLMNKFFLNVRILDEAILKATTKEEIFELLKALESNEKSLYDSYIYGKNARFYFNQKNAISAVRSNAKSRLAEIENKLNEAG